MPLKPSYLLLAGAGAIVAYSGFKGKNLSSSFHAVISGKSPAEALAANAITGTPGGSLAGGGSVFTGSPSAIADDAMRYQGLGYKWAGNGSTPGNWDCSSFVSYVLNHDLGIAIPGYKPHTFGGHGHGPVVAMYRVWGGAHTVSTPESGDLICFGVTHIGIYIGGGKMISALNPSMGTKVTNVFSGPTYRRVG
jgi:peptidoglycan DL-endopeptidase CwlO